ncbi:alpha/beta hydrolase [Nocardioides rubriscoriae]|uniref:alpha/beta hydrolase n=1 Tax=Nocardioides rubriscoriae TaxID=642762 RepID=UPI0011DFE957|nr:alpha/beta hydrolase fold domain-containing protein [Nocardioides rubriscoriae]
MSTTRFPARPVPPPSTISPEARAAVAAGSPLASLLFSEPEPSPHDADGWRAFSQRRDAAAAPYLAALAARYPCAVTTHDVSGLTVHELVAPADPAAPGGLPVVLYLHGGGYTSGSGEATVHLARSTAHGLGLPVWAPDYRLPPDHPFPAAVDDAVASYAFLLERHRPEDVVVAGRSAGGGLAAAAVLRARDQGLPLPAACLLQTPEADLTESGDSFALNDGVDNFLRPLPHANALYAAGHDLRHPHLSPLFGDFGAGFPPTILTSGTRDLFLSNTVLLHRALRRAGVRADLHVWEAMGHGGFFETAPEDGEVWAELSAFLRTVVRPAA